ncbi:Heat shock protein [Salix suchowensis]|nr:Heat shock protein [Salix suchowensis]
MVCLGFIIGCKHSRSITDYVLSALVIVTILICLRIFCYAIYRLLKKEHPRHGEDQSVGLEMQPETTRHAHQICICRALLERNFVSSAEDGTRSFVVQHN